MIKGLLILFNIGVFLFGITTGTAVGNILVYSILALLAVVAMEKLFFKNRVRKDAQYDSKYSKSYWKYRNKFDR